MPTKKVQPEVKAEILEEVEDVASDEVVELESEAKQEFRELIAKYKIQNPKKYAEKREALEKKLNSMQ